MIHIDFGEHWSTGEGGKGGQKWHDFFFANLSRTVIGRKVLLLGIFIENFKAYNIAEHKKVVVHIPEILKLSHEQFLTLTG